MREWQEITKVTGTTTVGSNILYVFMAIPIFLNYVHTKDTHKPTSKILHTSACLNQIFALKSMENLLPTVVMLKNPLGLPSKLLFYKSGKKEMSSLESLLP